MVKFVCYALRFVADAEARMAAQEGRDKGSNKEDKGGKDSLEEEAEEEEANNNDNSDNNNNNKDFSNADGS